MAWRDTLYALRDELAEVRAQRIARAAEEETRLNENRNQLVSFADSLAISGLLLEMNSTLLQDQGAVQRTNSWDTDIALEDDEDELDFDPEEDPDEDAVTAVLSWEEAGDREIAVEVVATPEGISLQVNGVEIRPERDALEQALVEAFRDELEL